MSKWRLREVSTLTEGHARARAKACEPAGGKKVKIPGWELGKVVCPSALPWADWGLS